MKTHKYRISEAAAGKILIKVMEMTRKSEISPAQFHDTMFAALNYIEAEVNPDMTANINPIKWHDIKEQIDKSARRSKAARERAARRRQSLIASSRHEVSEYTPTTPNVGPRFSVAAPGTEPIEPSVNPSPEKTAAAKAAAEKAERERLERLSREYAKVCNMSYW